VGVLVSTFMLAPKFLMQNWPEILFVVMLEVAAYAFCYFRFRKEIATHSILAKFWTLSLCAVIVELNLSGNSGLIFQSCFYLGVISRLEIIAIVLTLKNWTNDIPSLYHAWQLRQGKDIVRNKLFNG
jgi:CDP-diacylglycerol--glycerol-3-phosphate 3-phosphatidyltransferase